MLLEIEHWGRENPINPGADLTYTASSLFKVDPQPCTDVLAMAQLAQSC